MEKEVTVKKWVFVATLIFALCFDIPEIIITFANLTGFLIPIVEAAKLFANVIAIPSLILIFLLIGVKFDWKNLLKMIFGEGIKIIPGADAIPTFTLLVLNILGPLVAKDVLKQVGGAIPGGIGKNIEKAGNLAIAASKGDVKQIAQNAQSLAKSDIPESNITPLRETSPNVTQMDGIQKKKAA